MTTAADIIEFWRRESRSELFLISPLMCDIIWPDFGKKYSNMPIIANAIRKLRSDKRRASVNLAVRTAMKQAIASTRRKPSQKALAAAFAKLDRAVKANVVHKNKAARLKSRLSRLVKVKK